MSAAAHVPSSLRSALRNRHRPLSQSRSASRPPASRCSVSSQEPSSSTSPRTVSPYTFTTCTVVFSVV